MCPGFVIEIKLPTDIGISRDDPFLDDAVEAAKEELVAKIRREAERRRRAVVVLEASGISAFRPVAMHPEGV